MSEVEKERVRLLIEICTRSLSVMTAAAAIGNTEEIEKGRKSLEGALIELVGAK